MRDPYIVLGVPKSAPAADIKKAYRRLAKKFHPDQSTEPAAKDKFAEIGSAYEIVGDEKKRAQFDRGEIDAEGKPKFHGFDGFASGGRPGGAGGSAGFDNFDFNFGGGRGAGRPGAGAAGFDAADVFADLFSGATRGGARTGGFGQQQAPVSKGEDVQVTLVISLAESVHGAKKRVGLPNGRDLEINVPAGIEDGKQMRLKGQGQPGRGGAGDALVTVQVTSHPFRVVGSDVRLDLPITFYEAVLGGRVNVPTLEGLVEMGIPPATNGGRTMRLRGKGLLTAAKTRGDLLVTLRIILPDNAKDELATLAKDLAAKHPYDPRKAMR